MVLACNPSFVAAEQPRMACPPRAGPCAEPAPRKAVSFGEDAVLGTADADYDRSWTGKSNVPLMELLELRAQRVFPQQQPQQPQFSAAPQFSQAAPAFAPALHRQPPQSCAQQAAAFAAPAFGHPSALAAPCEADMDWDELFDVDSAQHPHHHHQQQQQIGGAWAAQFCSMGAAF